MRRSCQPEVEPFRVHGNIKSQFINQERESTGGGYLITSTYLSFGLIGQEGISRTDEIYLGTP